MSLTVRYEPDPEDDVGRLWMELRTASFAGRGFFWSYRNGLKDLADKLNAYPLPAPVEESWGFNQVEGADVILSLRISATSPTGHLGAEVYIADVDDRQQRVSANFATTYSQIETFRQELNSLIEGRADEATLYGSA